MSHRTSRLRYLGMNYFTGALVAFSAACGSVTSSPPGTPPPGGPDGGSPNNNGRCDTSADFATPTGRDFATSSTGGATPSFALAGDELEAVLAQGGQLLGARRITLANDFDAVAPLFAPVSRTDDAVSLTGDALHLYFRGDAVLFHSSRTSRDEPFGAPARVAIDGSALAVTEFAIASDGQTLYFVATGDPDGLLRAAAAIDADQFTTVSPVTSGAIERPVISADELVLYHGSGGDILISTRSTPDEMFGDPTPVAGVTSSAFEAPLAVSPDDCVLYFQSDRGGHIGLGDVWRATRP